MSHEIGVRVQGRRAIKQRWYQCAIMGEPVPECETIIENLPTSKFYGMRVCLKHRDEPSYNDFRVMHPPKQTESDQT